MVEVYALTESMAAAVIGPVHGEYKSGAVGLPAPDVEVRIADADTGVRILLGRLPPLNTIVVHTGKLPRAGDQDKITVPKASRPLRVTPVQDVPLTRSLKGPNHQSLRDASDLVIPVHVGASVDQGVQCLLTGQAHAYIPEDS